MRRRYDVETSGIEDCETLSQGRERERTNYAKSAHFIFKLTPAPARCSAAGCGHGRSQGSGGWWDHGGTPGLVSKSCGKFHISDDMYYEFHERADS